MSLRIWRGLRSAEAILQEKPQGLVRLVQWKLERLGTTTEDDAYAAYEELKKSDADMRPSTPVFELLNRFLDVAEERKGERTLEWYIRYLQPFVNFIEKLTIG